MPKKEVKKQVSKNKTSFFKSFKAELKKVIWPTPKQLLNNTAAVLSIVLITAVIVFVLDFAFESANKYGLDKIKQSVSNSTVENATEETNSEETDTETTSEETTEGDEAESTEEVEVENSAE